MLLPRRFSLMHLACTLACISLMGIDVYGQSGSVVIVDGDNKSGYGVVYQSPDRVVTALHVVAGRTKILVRFEGRTVEARIEKVYKSSDLALLKMNTPIGAQPLSLYSGEPPWGEIVDYWEVSTSTGRVTRKTTELEGATSLSKINARVNPPPGLENALCKDGGTPYPGMNTEIINFKEPNIKKAHSGSPLTFNGKIIGMIDGGATLLDGKSCIWAISKDDFAKLIAQGTAPPASMNVCASSGASGDRMYSGTRSDNPNLTPEEREAALLFEEASAHPMEVVDHTGDTLRIYNDQRMSFREIYETLQSETKQRIDNLFADEFAFDEGDRLSSEDLMEEVMDLHQGNRTGAFLILPYAVNKQIAQDTLGMVIRVTNADEISVLSVYLSKTNTPNEATAEMLRFKGMLQSLGQQVDPTADNVKDYNCEPGDPYYREYIENSQLNQQTHLLASEFSTSMTINESDFLGVWLQVPDWKEMWKDKEARKFYYLLQSCVLFADFVIY